MYYKKFIIVLLLLLCTSYFSINGEVVRIDENEYAQSGVFEEICGGQWYAAGLTPEGELYTWGNNDQGMLGVGDYDDRTTPTEITVSFGLSEGEQIENIACGGFHMLASTSDSRVFAWGKNQNRPIGDGTTTDRLVPTEITSFFALNLNEEIIDVAASLYSSFAITSDGRYFSWGTNSGSILGNGNTTLVSTVTDHTSHLPLTGGEYFVELDSSSGSNSILAITNLGNLYGWGSNSSGELFLNDTTSRTVPTNLMGAFTFGVNEEITDFASGSGFSVVATNEGAFYVAGKNSQGQLGDGTTVAKYIPTELSANFGLDADEYITEIDANTHTIIATNKNKVFVWGYQPGGQVNGTMWGSVYNPINISNHFNFIEGEHVSYIGGSYSNSYVITNEGHYWAWGNNNEGQLSFDHYTNVLGTPGKGPDYFDSHTIFEFVPTGILKTKTFNRHTLVLGTNGEVTGFGVNTYGQLGLGFTSDGERPRRIDALIALNENETIIDIGVGLAHSIFLTDEGRVFTSGYNSNGQLGKGNTASSYSFTDITSLLPIDQGEFITEIYAGGDSNFLISNTGRIIAFGDNDNGQLGIGDFIDQTSPMDITSYIPLNPLEVIQTIEVGLNHTLILTSDDRVITFGDNQYGQLGDGTNTDSPTPIVISTSSCFNPINSSIVDITVGYNFNIFVTDNNEACSWGQNTHGSLGEGGAGNRNIPFSISNQFPLNTDFLKVEAGSAHVFVITTTDFYTWGEGWGGKLGTNGINDSLFPLDVTSQMDTGIDVPIDFSLGLHTSFIITTSNLYGFGRNDDYDLGLDDEVIVAYDPLKLSIEVDDLGLIKYSYTKSFHYESDDSIELKIYPEHDIFHDIEYIYINGTQYAKSNMTYEFGEITISIPNTYVLNNIATFDIEQIILTQGSVSATGSTSLETEITADTTAPTYDLITSQTVEVYTPDIDWTTYITNLEDDSNGVITLTEIDNVDYNTLGTYTVNVLATDGAGNSLGTGFSVEIVDTTLPTITYNGPTSVEAGSTEILFLEESTIGDNYDINPSISIIESVDWNTPAEYTVEIIVEDSSGNIQTKVFTITIVDTTQPYFDPIDHMTFEVGEINDIDWTVYISNLIDNSDTEITTHYTTDINYSLTGNYTVTIYADDLYGNSFSFSFMITLEDTTAPIITPLNDIIIEINETVDYPNYFQVIDAVEGDVSQTLTFDDSLVSLDTVGIYNLYVYAEDSFANETMITVTVVVQDTLPPTFDEINDMVFEFEVTNTYDWLSLVENLYDNSMMTPSLQITENTVNWDEPGNYQVTITAKDEELNIYSQTFNVVITDGTNPQVTLNPSLDTIYIGETYNDMGITVYDAQEYTIDVDNLVDVQSEGVYTITYTVTDSSGNITEITRFVNILNKQLVATFDIGDNLTTLEVGENFIYGTCEVTIDNTQYSCQKKDDVNTLLPGTYRATYSITVDNVTYEYYQIVTVVDEVVVTIYYKKEDELEVLL